MSRWIGVGVSVVFSLWALRGTKEKMIYPSVASHVLFLVMLPTYMFTRLMKLADMHVRSNASVESWLDNNSTETKVEFKQIL